MAPKKKESVVQLSPQEAEAVVRQYMKEQYRPYSVSDLVLNLHGRVNKSTMLKVLESLVSQQELLAKTYGKTTYYVYKEVEIDEQALDKELTTENINSMKEELENKTLKVTNLQLEYEKLTSLPSNEDAEKSIVILSQEIAKLEDQLQVFAANVPKDFNQENINKVKAQVKSVEIIFKKRKRLLDNFIALIKEGMDNYVTVLDQMGIDLETLKELNSIK